MRQVILSSLFLSISLVGCGQNQTASDTQVSRRVLTKPLAAVSVSELSLTGVVKSRQEIPIAFQVNGRILKRLVEPGERVTAGQVIFALDPKDLAESLQAAEAQTSAAKASYATADADLKRIKALIKNQFASSQALDQATLRFNEATANLQAAQAQQTQATHALQYAAAIAERDGIIVDISAEAGQVVVAGQRVAGLANDRELDVEVQLPERLIVPEQGQLLAADGSVRPLILRSAAGASDPLSLTRRARYKIEGDFGDLGLGRVVMTQFKLPTTEQNLREIPLAALDHRGEHAQIWQIKDGKAVPTPIQVVRLDRDSAQITSDLAVGTPIIALGTHLLQPGMAVQELGQ